ncbi:MAG: carboxylesterase [Kiritimatiellia bacterium]|jgi:esterase/lipase
MVRDVTTCGFGVPFVFQSSISQIEMYMIGLFIGLLVLLILLTCIDFCYGLRVRKRMQAWEASLSRGPDGVVEGCAPYELGTGQTGVLLVHGFADSPALYRQIAPALAAIGYRIRAIRLPGWAEPVERLASVTRSDWLEAIEQGVADLKKQGCLHVVVVAHSLGAACALYLAARQRLDVAALVTLTPMLKVSDKRSPLLSSRTWHEISNALFHHIPVFECVYPVDQQNPEGRDENHRDRFIPRSVYDELFALMDALGGSADHIRLPVLMVLSKKDQIVDSDQAAAFFKSLGGEHKKLVALEDSGHVLPLDYEWEAVVELTRQFISEHGSE